MCILYIFMYDFIYIYFCCKTSVTHDEGHFAPLTFGISHCVEVCSECSKAYQSGLLRSRRHALFGASPTGFGAIFLTSTAGSLSTSGTHLVVLLVSTLFTTGCLTWQVSTSNTKICLSQCLTFQMVYLVISW